MPEKEYNNVKKEIRSVLMTYPNGVILDGFLKTYHSLLGQRLPSRTLGFTSDLEFLKSLPDVVHVSTDQLGKVLLTGISNENTEHIQKLVSRQRKTKPTNNQNKARQQSRLPFGLPRGRDQKPFIPGPLKAEIIKIATSFPDGITLAAFVLAYHKKFKKYLNLEKGLESLENMINSLSELEIKPVKNEKKIFVKDPSLRCMESSEKRFPKPSPSKPLEVAKTEANKVSIDSSFDNSGIPLEIQKNFQMLLEKCPEGILAVHFPPLYENLTGKSFDLLELGYNSILDLIDALPWIFRRELDPKTGRDWIIFHANAPKSYDYGKKDLNKASPACKKTSPLKFREVEPVKAASPLVQFMPPSLPQFLDVDSYFPVFVSAVVNPGLFWFHVFTQEAIETLESLENELESFYNENCEKYKMCDKDVVIGATCVTFLAEDQQWYRTVIKSIPSLDLVNVFFVDYGSMENVPKSNLCYLKRDFSDYPAQAFKAKLAGLNPAKNRSWDISAQKRFIELCETPSLMACLDAVENNSYSIYLCDTSNTIDIHIEDVLVEEGIAEVEAVTTSFKENSTKAVSSPVLLPMVNDSSAFHETEDSAISEREILTDSDGTQGKGKLAFSSDRDSNDSAGEYNCKTFQKRFVKKVQLCEGNQICVINFSGNPYVAPGDLSKLFWKEKDAKYLEERLNYKEIRPPALILTRENNAELFKQCEWFQLPDLKSRGHILTLYPLEWALKILNIFGHPSICLRLIVQNELRTFSPSSNIWKDFEYLKMEEIDKIEKEIAENFEKLCLYDLKAKKEAFEIKKLKLLHRNIDAEDNEIKRIDLQLMVIKKRIDYISSICSQYSAS